MHSPFDISPGKNCPKEVNVIIEIPKGSKNKYELDKASGLIKLDRALHTAQDYPFDYGYVPQTLWEDGDPLDVVLLTTYPLFPGVLVEARPVAIMHMNDSGEGDDKVIAVPVHDPRWDDTKDIRNINKHTLKELEHFFMTYKKIQGKKVGVTGFSGAVAAKNAILKSIKLYKNKHHQK